MDVDCTVTPYTVHNVVVALLPQAASRHLPSRSQVMVEGRVGGQPFSHPIEPDGRGSHWLEIDDGLQQAGVHSDRPVRIELRAIKTWPEPELPTDFRQALLADTAASATWRLCTPMAHWEWLRWIQSTTQAATRQRRIQVSCSKLTAGMRRPCCFNRALCCVPAVSKTGFLIEPTLSKV